MSSQKPEKTPLEEKKKLALIFSGVITFLIFIVWIFVFVEDARKELDKTAENRVEVYTVFQDTIGKFADKLVNQFKSIPEKMVATSSLATSTPLIGDVGTTTGATIENTSTTTESTNQ